MMMNSKPHIINDEIIIKTLYSIVCVLSNYNRKYLQTKIEYNHFSIEYLKWHSIAYIRKLIREEKW